MITLITGGPGMGKTALAVQLLQTQYNGRALFTNINGLALEHSPLPKLDEWTEEIRNDQGTSEHKFTFPPGSIVVIDECQQFFRPRAAGSRVPPYVSAFETHRHTGVDFILITQGSRLIDSNLRSLVKGGLHIFLKSSYLGRFRYEKSEVINEDDKTSYTLATRRKYTLPKDVFHLYKSAELHTKAPRAKLPLAAYIVIGGVVVGAALAVRVYGTIASAVSKDSDAVTIAGDSPGPMSITPPPHRAQPAALAAAVPERLIDALTPRDDHNPLSAPLYAAVAPSVTPPEIVGCIASKRVCTCYSQQRTPVWVPEEQCRQRAAGLYFDPYRQVGEAQTTASSLGTAGRSGPAS